MLFCAHLPAWPLAHWRVVRRARMFQVRPLAMRPSFFHHLHPPTLPAPQARWRHTLGAGGLAVYFTLVLILTGALEMFYYVPTPTEAALSVQTITYLVPLGGFIRNLHYWATQGLLITVGLHTLRVILTGAYARPRRFNYWLGLGLLVLTLGLAFSGYVLRWDEGVRWALVAGTNLLQTVPALGDWLYGFAVGGSAIGPATLTRFYAWHIFGLTLLIVILGVWHLFRVRRDGGIAAPPPSQRDAGRLTRNELVRREALAALLASAALVLLAALLPAPIAPPMSTTSIAADSRAPWFLLWIQQLLRWGDGFWMGVALPFGLLTLIACVPLLSHPPATDVGRWFARPSRAVQIGAVFITGLLALLTLLALRP